MANHEYKILSEDAIKYLCGLIRDVSTLPSSLIDDINIQTVTSYSSFKLEQLLAILKQENEEYADALVAGLNKLTKEIITDQSQITNENVLYLLLVDSANSIYQQWLLINGTPTMIGTTEMSLDSVYSKGESDSKFATKQSVEDIVNVIGTDTLSTTATTLKGAINEVKGIADDKADKSEIPTSLPANGGNADTVNNHTVKSDVPVDAVFTDTVYDDTEIKGSITKLNRNLTENNVTLAVVGNTYITSYSAWNVGKEVFFNFDLKVNDILNANAWYDIGNLSISPNQNFYYTCIYNYNQIGMIQITKDGLLKLYIGNVIYESNTDIIASGVYHI